MKDDKRSFTVRIDNEIYRKLRIKSALKDLSVNAYVGTLIFDDVNDVDLSAFSDLIKD